MRYIEPFACAHPLRVHDGAETASAISLKQASTIAEMRTLEAKRLLVHTEMPISAIAQRLGFDEATNFTKFFRSIEGCTPGDFRRRFDVSL